MTGTRPTGITPTNSMGRLVEAETDNCTVWPPTPASIITDEWFSYNGMGEAIDIWQKSPTSRGYMHANAAYHANGELYTLYGYNAVGNLVYGASWGLDGKGRVNTTGSNPGTTNMLLSATYNAADQVTGVTFGTSDSETFYYDPNSGRLQQYQSLVNGNPITGNLFWNANGSLRQLQIDDTVNAANTQVCNVNHDDLTRLTNYNCGNIWAQTFSYDRYGNIQKSGSVFFAPTYNAATNRMTNIAGCTPTYDGNGNTIYDCLHNYTWSGYDEMLTVDNQSVTHDAFGRYVEISYSGVPNVIMYSPTGFKMEVMNSTAWVPLPGGTQSVWAPFYFSHVDWLASSRIGSDGNRNILYDFAYAPFGETYAEMGTPRRQFTGMDQDTAGQNSTSGLYDFPARKYAQYGRWISPDPAGLGAVDPGNPQSWNRYVYVLNRPVQLVDPLGLDPCHQDDDCPKPPPPNPFLTDPLFICGAIPQLVGCWPKAWPDAVRWTDYGFPPDRRIPADGQVVSQNPPANNGKPCSSHATVGQRVAAGVQGTLNIALGEAKTAIAGGVAIEGVAGAPETGGLSLAATAIAGYAAFSSQGQVLSGMGQLYTAFSGNLAAGQGIQQVGDIMAGPLVGVPTLVATQNAATAQRFANYESFIFAGTGFVNSKTITERIASAVDFGLSAVGLAGNSACD